MGERLVSFRSHFTTSAPTLSTHAPACLSVLLPTSSHSTARWTDPENILLLAVRGASVAASQLHVDALNPQIRVRQGGGGLFREGHFQGSTGSFDPSKPLKRANVALLWLQGFFLSLAPDALTVGASVRGTRAGNRTKRKYHH